MALAFSDLFPAERLAVSGRKNRVRATQGHGGADAG